MKKFLLKIFFFLLPVFGLCGYYLIFQHPKFQKLADNGNYNLSSLGFILFEEEYANRIIANYEEENQVKVFDYEKYDSHHNVRAIITIGDSFSKPRNGRYSNYLAHIVSERIEYLHVNENNPFNSLLRFLSSEQDLPDVIIVESVERHLVNRLLELDFSKDWHWHIEKNEKESENNQNNIYRLVKRTTDYYKILFTKEENRPVRHLNLNRELFSCKGKERDFYFYEQEITITNTKEEIEMAAQNLDSLFALAEKKKITLIVLVAADAYDVYQSYVVSNPYPAKSVLDELSSKIHNPCYIDTKQLFMPYLARGVKDIYWATDTHWSPVGAKIVAGELKRKLDSLGVLQR